MIDTIQSVSAAYDSLRQDYSAVKKSRHKRRRTGFVRSGSHADYHYARGTGYFELMELARDLERNDLLISQALKRLVANVVQQGFTLDVDTGDESIDEDLSAMWTEWSESEEMSSLDMEASFHDLEFWLLYQHLTDGDVFVLPTNRQKLEIIEGHRVRSPRTTRNIVLGVLLNDNRVRNSVFIASEDVAAHATNIRVGDMREIKVRDSKGNRQVFQLYNRRRATLTRGLTCLAPIIEAASMLDDVTFARLVQQQAVSAWALIRERPLDFVSSRGQDTTQSAALPENLVGELRGIAAGLQIKGEPGEAIKGFAPDVPAPNSLQFSEQLMNMLSVNLEMPLAVFMLDPSKTNFSGWRGAIDQARLGWRRTQLWYSRKLHAPTYRWRVRNAIAGDRMLEAASQKTGINIFGHSWTFPRWPYIQPMEDVTADIMRERGGQISKRRLQREFGRDWKMVAREIVEDNSLAVRLSKQAAAEINAEFQDDLPVTWRDLIALPVAEGLNLNMSLTPGQTQTDTTPE